MKLMIWGLICVRATNCLGACDDVLRISKHEASALAGFVGGMYAARYFIDKDSSWGAYIGCRIAGGVMGAFLGGLARPRFRFCYKTECNTRLCGGLQAQNKDFLCGYRPQKYVAGCALITAVYAARRDLDPVQCGLIGGIGGAYLLMLRQ